MTTSGGSHELRGIAWDDSRAVSPLLAASADWSGLRLGPGVSWDRRPLPEFAHAPIDDLVEEYDLILLDHPHIGEVAARQLVVPLEDLVGPGSIDEYRSTVGRSFESYSWQGKTWAFPLDAATQVAARRPDLVTTDDLPVSATWSEILRYQQESGTRLVAIPFGPDSPSPIMSLFSICAGIGTDPCTTPFEFVDDETGVAALDILSELVARAHPSSLEMGTLQFYESMGSKSQIGYCPLIFMFSNYSRPGYRRRVITFEDVPDGGSGPIGAILGGAGMAVSAHSTQPVAAAKYGNWLMSADVQGGRYVENLGQPAHLEAWENGQANAFVSSAFTATRRSMESAYLRPRFPGYIEFQRSGARIIHDGVTSRAALATVLRRLNESYRACTAGRSASELGLG